LVRKKCKSLANGSCNCEIPQINSILLAENAKETGATNDDEAVDDIILRNNLDYPSIPFKTVFLPECDQFP
jgi:hypothetical protein